jgi:hypothetical protein
MVKTKRSKGSIERVLALLEEIQGLEVQREALLDQLTQGQPVFLERLAAVQRCSPPEIIHCLEESGQYPRIRLNAKANARYYTLQKLRGMLLSLDQDVVNQAQREKTLQRVEQRLQHLDALLYPPGIPRDQRANEIAEALQERTRRKVLAL